MKRKEGKSEFEERCSCGVKVGRGTGQKWCENVRSLRENEARRMFVKLTVIPRHFVHVNAFMRTRNVYVHSHTSRICTNTVKHSQEGGKLQPIRIRNYLKRKIKRFFFFGIKFNLSNFPNNFGARESLRRKSPENIKFEN